MRLATTDDLHGNAGSVRRLTISVVSAALIDPHDDGL